MVLELLGPTGKIQRKNLAAHFATVVPSSNVSSSDHPAIDSLALVKQCLAQVLGLDVSEIKDESTLFQLGRLSLVFSSENEGSNVTTH